MWVAGNNQIKHTIFFKKNNHEIVWRFYWYSREKNKVYRTGDYSQEKKRQPHHASTSDSIAKTEQAYNATMGWVF